MSTSRFYRFIGKTASILHKTDVVSKAGGASVAAGLAASTSYFFIDGAEGFTQGWQTGEKMFEEKDPITKTLGKLSSGAVIGTMKGLQGMATKGIQVAAVTGAVVTTGVLSLEAAEALLVASATTQKAVGIATGIAVGGLFVKSKLDHKPDTFIETTDTETPTRNKSEITEVETYRPRKGF